MFAGNLANMHLQKTSVPSIRQQGSIGLNVVARPRQTAVSRVWAQQEDPRYERALGASRQDMYE